VYGVDMTSDVQRCGWSGTDPLMIRYHDEEWGVPLRDDVRLFEFLVLDGAQAGLSWSTILKKRAAYQAAFDGFVPEKVAKYGEEKIQELLQNAGIVRNRLKVNSAVANARAFPVVQKEFGSFSEYIWGFVGGKTIQNRWTRMDQIPAKSPEAEAMSKDLVRRGFRFVGPTICYAFMQAAGLVNDHLVGCFRYGKLMGR
jgi:DNA-3-methyladenine glycosylase I